MSELARGRLSEIAQKIFHSMMPGAERMDAVMHLVGAGSPPVGGESREEKVERRRPRAAGGAGSLHHSPLTSSPLTTHSAGRRQWCHRCPYRPARASSPSKIPARRGSPFTLPVGSLPGQFSGLHMVCLMYAAFKIFNPTADIGFDLAQEYAVAEQMAPDRSRS
jgi:hypothetical protein